MPPKDPISEFINIIEKEIELYRRFRELLLEEQNILVSGNVLNVQANLREQAVLTREIRMLEECRIRKSEEFAEDSSISSGSMSLRNIAESITDERHDRMLTLLDEFRYTVQDITKINKNNGQLIEHGISFIREQVEVIYEAVDKDCFYTPVKKSSWKAVKPLRLFDRKV